MPLQVAASLPWVWQQRIGRPWRSNVCCQVSFQQLHTQTNYGSTKLLPGSSPQQGPHFASCTLVARMCFHSSPRTLAYRICIDARKAPRALNRKPSCIHTSLPAHRGAHVLSTCTSGRPHAKTQRKQQARNLSASNALYTCVCVCENPRCVRTCINARHTPQVFDVVHVKYAGKRCVTGQYRQCPACRYMECHIRAHMFRRTGRTRI